MQTTATTYQRNDLLQALESEDVGIYLDSNGHNDSYGKYDWLVAGGAQRLCTTTLEDLRRLKESTEWLFGGLTYDLKNQLEKLQSANQDLAPIPPLAFFEPSWVVYEMAGEQFCWTHPNGMLPTISAKKYQKQPLTLLPTMEKADYLKRVKAIQEHIQMGDIYELTFCQGFSATVTHFDALSAFSAINKKTNAPFSCYFKWFDNHAMCGSPERYLAKRAQLLASQPIKGTAPRDSDPKIDQRNSTDLKASVKERAENVMIVDLVRNDLSRVAASGSVHVPELFGIYTFETVHQMISTITAELRADKDAISAIEATFPMGSMTGAPKVRAMELIEKYETLKRGLFSGALGYFDPVGDMDFNVVIRTLLYHAATDQLSLQVGSAITILSDAEAEYDECLLKAAAIVNALK